jgi:fibronectin type 3 domain-containing protein
MALVLCSLCQVGETASAQDAPGTTARVQAALRELPSKTAATVTPVSHSVTLSWQASVPASKSARDAIIGYIVYRSTKPHDLNATPINTTRVAGTTYVDPNVEAGKTYYYVTRAVSASGALSGASNEAIAAIPPAPSH